MHVPLLTVLLTLVASCVAPGPARLERGYPGQGPGEAGQSPGGPDASPAHTGPTHANELSLALGEFQEASEQGVRLALDYERRAADGWAGPIDERFGFGVILDADLNPVESLLYAVQAVYHPVEPVSLIVAAGFSNNDDPDTGSDSWLLRLGTRYSFHLAPNVGIGPEIFYDLLEGGERKGVLAFALTYQF